MLAKYTGWSGRAVAGGAVALLLGALLWAPPAGAQEDEPQVPKRTVAELKAVIAEAGKAPPQWVEDIPLSYPKTLDLTWSKQPKGADKNLGTYSFIIAGRNWPNARRAVKFYYHVLDVNKGVPKNLVRTELALAQNYSRLEEYAHAAYYYEKARARQVNDLTDLARCYAQLGCEEAAMALLKTLARYVPHNAQVAKVLGDMGKLDSAVNMAEKGARAGRAETYYQAAGNACRQAGDAKRAVAYYQKVLGATKKNRRAIERAKECLNALKGLSAVTPEPLKDGTYKGASKGYIGPVNVEVVVTGGAIESCKVTQNRENRMLGAEVTVTARIVKAGGIKGVDTVTGATITSEAIINAATLALKAAVAK